MATVEVEVQDLTEGDLGVQVKKLQLLLHYAIGKPNVIDGIYGEQTIDAVQEFQDTYELPQSGSFSVTDWQQLLALPL